MSRSFRPPEPANLDLNLAPMVDVMMCLIIFFLLASKMVASENFEMRLPWATAARELDKSELGNRVTINVVAGDEQAGLQPRYITAEWDGQQVVQVERSPLGVEQLLVERQQRAARLGQNLRCKIRADGDAAYADVEVVLRACGVANIGNIVFAARQGTDPEGAL